MQQQILLFGLIFANIKKKTPTSFICYFTFDLKSLYIWNFIFSCSTFNVNNKLILTVSRK